MPNISESRSRKMVTFVHLYKAAVVDYSNANLLMGRDGALRPEIGVSPRAASVVSH